MLLKEIEIKNFGLIQEAHLLFPEANPVIGVIARYEAEEDSGRSNRAGKSTLVDANEYLLFGKARTRHHAKLINRTARAAGEGMQVRGVYELHDGREIEIIRTRTNEGKGTASVTGFEGSGWGEVNDAIVELIGNSHDEYKNTACFSQGDIHTFMKSGPKEKRVLLLDWLNQTRWETRSEFSKQRAAEAENKISQLTGTLNALPEPEGDPEELKGQAQEASDAGNIAVAERNEERKKLKALEDEYEIATDQTNLRTRKKYITQHIEEIEAALEEAEGNAEKKIVLEKEVRLGRNHLKEVREEHKEDFDVLRNDFFLAQDVWKLASGKHKSALKNSGTCPVLNESCDRIDTGQVEELERLEIEADIKSTEAKDKYNRTKNRQDKETRELDGVIADKEDIIRALGNTDTDRLEKKLDGLDGELEEVNSGLSGSVRTPTDITYDKTELTEGIESLNRQIGKYSAQAVSFYDAAKRSREHADRKDRIVTAIEAARLDLGAWQYCAYMFGDRGIPNEFIKGAFETLESDINYILGRMNCGLSIEFKPYRETNKYEASCLACGNEFKARQRKCSACGDKRQHKRVEQLVLIIHDAAEGMQSDFELDSGGGKILISFAVRLALLFFKIRQGNGETPPIILDEIAGMLDAVNRQAIMDVILNILTEKYGVKQIFWISHNTDILDMIENAIVVTRIGAASTVDWL